MTQAGKAVIDQQEGSEAGASGNDLGAPFSLPALCEERTYSPTASWWWYGLRPSCALRGRLRRGVLPCRYIPADANGGLCIGRSCADALGDWEPSATNKLRRVYTGALLATTISVYK